MENNKKASEALKTNLAHDFVWNFENYEIIGATALTKAFKAGYEKAEQRLLKEIVYTTEDGVDLIERDKVYVIKKGEYKLFEQYRGNSITIWLNGWYSKGMSTARQDMQENYLFFSSEAAAREHINLNSPKYTLSQVERAVNNWSMYGVDAEYIKKLLDNEKEN